MFVTKFKPVLVLLLFIEVEISNGMPQGLFSQGFSIPRFVANIPNVRIESPIKNSVINLFGKQKSDIQNSKKVQDPVNLNQIGQRTEKVKAEQNLLSNIDNEPQITNQGNGADQSKKSIQDTGLPNLSKKDTEVINNFNSILENNSYDNINYTEITTEFITETTTDDYETTTIEDVFNRASPQLVASLLG